MGDGRRKVCSVKNILNELGRTAAVNKMQKLMSKYLKMQIKKQFRFTLSFTLTL